MAAASFDREIVRALPDLEKRLQEDLKPAKMYSLSAEEEVECTPIVVCELISRQELDRWVRKNGGALQRWQYKPLTKTRGSVVVYSLPTIVHTVTANEVVDMIREQIVLINPAARLMRTLKAGGGARYDVGDRLQAPDQCLIPAGASPGTYPTLVVEVAYKHESWEDLLEKLRRWMSPVTTVQIAIGVQVGLIRRRIIVMQRKVRIDYEGVEKHEYVAEAVDFDFGRDHEVCFPTRALYFGVELPDALQEHESDEVVLDLTELRSSISAVIPKQ